MRPGVKGHPVNANHPLSLSEPKDLLVIDCVAQYERAILNEVEAKMLFKLLHQDLVFLEVVWLQLVHDPDHELFVN